MIAAAPTASTTQRATPLPADRPRAPARRTAGATARRDERRLSIALIALIGRSRSRGATSR